MKSCLLELVCPFLHIVDWRSCLSVFCCVINFCLWTYQLTCTHLSSEDYRDEELVHIQGTKVAASLAKERTGLEQLVNFWGGRLLSTFKGDDYAYMGI